MAIRQIVIYPDERLREKAAPIEQFDNGSGTSALATLLNDMAETMYDAHGIGLAATQIGVMERVAVVDVGSNDEEALEEAPTKRKGLKGWGNELIELVNPEILQGSGKTRGEEGCLSIPDYREYVERAAKVTVKAQDRTGKEFILEAEGLLAVCLQHEIDHLNGILFVDRISPLKKQFFLKKYSRRIRA